MVPKHLEKVIKASFVYTEQGGYFYSLTLHTSDGQQLKLDHDEADEWLKERDLYLKNKFILQD